MMYNPQQEEQAFLNNYQTAIGSGVSGLAETPHQPEIPREHDRLHKELNILHDAFNALVTRLGPILNNPSLSPVSEQTLIEEDTPRTEVGCRFRAATERVSYLASQLDKLLCAIEV